METYLISLNGMSWFWMTVRRRYCIIPALACEVARGGMPDDVVSVEWVMSP